MKLNVIDRHKKSLVKLCSPNNGQLILTSTDFDRRELMSGMIWQALGGDMVEVLSTNAYGFLLLITRFQPDEDDELCWVSSDWRPINLSILKRETISPKKLKALVADESSLLLQESDLGTLVYRVNTKRQVSELVWVKPPAAPASKSFATLQAALV
ncbi:MAG: hypothetical protein Q4G02_00280 [bacterium]|nr:hypothetical protein [bacterium]